MTAGDIVVVVVIVALIMATGGRGAHGGGGCSVKDKPKTPRPKGVPPSQKGKG